MKTLALWILLLPLAGALISGLLGKRIGRRASHTVTTGLVAVAFILAIKLAYMVFTGPVVPYDLSVYTWGIAGSFTFKVGFLIDRLSTMMVLTVTFVSMLVHLYSIGYMEGDPGYQRFFSYVSLFTFAMLSLVLADSFLLLFFGWEGVGLVSYLLIGFWFNKTSAVEGSLKAFIVNRVGDFGFILAIGAVLSYFGSLNYLDVFHHVPSLLQHTITWWPGHSCSAVTLICMLLFIGAAGKSAQVPLHVWLPESMEGPTPISALIHAATMVTAGVYMIARMSPLFEHSTAALSVTLVLGATTCLFMGILGIFQYDIKRIVAYSTLSQLGYMMVALGASAYAAGMFHLFTHACFKALLFLAAGSVIIAMHHEQDVRKMGGLWRYMPITYICFLIGALSLSAIPPFAGFYSKDSIIDAVHLSQIPGAGYAYFCTLAGSFLTALYIFRGFFLTFHGKPRMGQQLQSHLKESPWVVTLPLIVLAIPSVFLGSIAIQGLLFDANSWFGHALTVLPQHNVLGQQAAEFNGAFTMALSAVTHLPFWLALAGIATAWVFCLGCPDLGTKLAPYFRWFLFIMDRRYGFDDFNNKVLARGSHKLGEFFYKVGDLKVIDGIFVNGSGIFIAWCSRVFRRVQTGYIYHYAFAMVVGVFALMAWLWLGY